MPELNASDLDKLFRTAGHSAPRTNLADRIMARVAVTPLVRSTEVKPLIGKRTWWAIALCAFSLVGILLLIGTTGSFSGPGLGSLMGELLDRATPPLGNWPLWVIGVSVCLLMLALMDRALGQRGEGLRN
jgi:hypothetical protein